MSDFVPVRAEARLHHSGESWMVVLVDAEGNIQIIETGYTKAEAERRAFTVAKAIVPSVSGAR
jgi:hypothetical protein